MAMRQYIGARYTTKIYENSLDPSSAEWEAGVTYEPLTLVTYLNSSYLSKKEVPGSVGDPAANPSYWVVTGAYNGQIMSLQNQIDNINNTIIPAIIASINDINKHDNVIVIADSYGQGIGSQTPFTTPLQTYLDLDNDHYHAWAEGSLGIYHVGWDGHNAETLLQAHENDISDPDDVSDIVIALGANDHQEAYSDIVAAGQSLMAYCHSTYPNATIHIGCMSSAITLRDNSGQTLFWGCVKAYTDIANTYQGRYMTNIEYIMRDPRNYISDKVHPTTAAGNILAQNITACVYGGCANYKSEQTTQYITSSYGTGYITSQIDNGVTFVRVDFGFTSFTGSGINNVLLGTYDADGCAWGQGGSPIYTQGYVWSPNGLNPIYFLLANGDLYINPLQHNTTGVFDGSTTKNLETTIPTIRN